MKSSDELERIEAELEYRTQALAVRVKELEAQMSTLSNVVDMLFEMAKDVEEDEE